MNLSATTRFADADARTDAFGSGARESKFLAATALDCVRTEHLVRRFHKLSAAGLLLFHCTMGPTQAAGDDVQVTDRLGARGEVEYEIHSGADCRIRWAVSRTGVNAGIAQLRSDCQLTMTAQLALQSKVLARVATDEPGIRTLFWGRLGKWPEWSERLVLAAMRSASWDAKTGQPKAGANTNAFVLALISQTDMFSELRQLLADLHLRMKVSGVEKVSVAAAGSLPSFVGHLAPERVSASDKVPLDCLIWFSVERMNKEGRSQ
jgi:hypothetical protein